MEYKYPESINEFTRGTVYQVREPLDDKWSEDKVVTHLCNSVKNYFVLLIGRKGVRIKYDK